MTYPFVHAGLTTTSRGQSISVLRDNVDRRNPRVVREVITFWHRFVRINVELFAVVLCRLPQNVQVRARVGLRRESQSHRWPTVLVFNEVESLLVQIVVDVNPFWVAGVCHAVVADEDDVDDFSEIASLQTRVEILSKNVDGLQRILFSS